MGIPSSAHLLDCLLARQISAGSKYAEGDSYTVPQSRQQAADARDALARALYGGMFDGLVRRINQALLEPRAGRARSVAILDIFGFEHFRSNHFEQFCINYANEKLQGHFNEFNFALEVLEHERKADISRDDISGARYSYRRFRLFGWILKRN